VGVFGIFCFRTFNLWYAVFMLVMTCLRGFCWTLGTGGGCGFTVRTEVLRLSLLVEWFCIGGSCGERILAAITSSGFIKLERYMFYRTGLFRIPD